MLLRWRSLSLTVAGARPAAAADAVNPHADFKAFRDYFTKRFPNVPLNDFVNGPYSMDADLRKQWQAIDEFPPYDFAVDRGKEMFATPFKNGKTYGDCFANKGIGIRQNYPYFDDKDRRGHHARACAQSLPRGQWRSSLTPTSRTRWLR